MMAGYLLDISWWKYPEISRTVWPDLPPALSCLRPATTGHHRSQSRLFLSRSVGQLRAGRERLSAVQSVSRVLVPAQRRRHTHLSPLSRRHSNHRCPSTNGSLSVDLSAYHTYHGDSLLPSQSSGKPFFLCSFSFLRQTRRRRQTNIW